MKRFPHVAVAVVIPLLAAASGAVSCSEREKQAEVRDPRERLRPTDEQTLAGVREHSEQGLRLRDIMRELNEHHAYAPTNDLPADPESNKRVEPRTFEEVLALSGALADAAARIPPAADDIRMFHDERQAFDEEAADLRRHALDLGAAAKARNVERVQRTLDRINRSCVECHGRFGDFAGRLEPMEAMDSADAPVPASDARDVDGPGDPASPRAPGDAR